MFFVTCFTCFFWGGGGWDIELLTTCMYVAVHFLTCFFVTCFSCFFWGGGGDKDLLTPNTLATQVIGSNDS